MGRYEVMASRYVISSASLAFFVGLLTFFLCFMHNRAEAIGAQLEAPTIRDMYFGFVVAGMISYGQYPNDEYLMRRANQLADRMMIERNKK